jgi:RNA polymerase sigma factor (sigma-70 family)
MVAIDGRRARLTGEQQAIAADHLAFARSLARPYKQGFPAWRDEFESAACFALVDAASRYDAGGDRKFTTFAGCRIRGELIDVVRQIKRDRAKALTRHDKNIPDPRARPVGREIEDADAFEGRIRILRPRAREILRAIVLGDQTQEEAGLSLGLPQSTVSQTVRRAGTLIAR